MDSCQQRPSCRVKTRLSPLSDRKTELQEQQEDKQKEGARVKTEINEVKTRLSPLSDRKTELQEQQEDKQKEGARVKTEINEWRVQCISQIETKATAMTRAVEAFVNKELGTCRPEQEKVDKNYDLLKKYCEKAESKSKQFLKQKGNASSMRQLQGEMKQIVEEGKNHEKNDVFALPNRCTSTKSAKFLEGNCRSILDSITALQGVAFDDENVRKKQILTKPNESDTRTPEFSTYVRSFPVKRGKPKPRFPSYCLQSSYRTKGPMKRSFGSERSELRGLKKPWGIAVTANDSIVVADSNNHRIQIFDTSGKSLRTFGSLGDGDGNFRLPYGVCITMSGQIAVADTFNDRIQIFDENGRFRCSFRLGLKSPYSIAANKDGLLFVGDQSTRINVFSSSGKRVGSFGESWLESSTGQKYLAVTKDEKVIVANQSKNKIGVFDKSYQLLWEKEMGGESDAGTLFAVACDQSGNIAVADGMIKVLDSAGNLISSFGDLNQATGVGFLRNGDIVCSDAFNNTVHIF